MNKLEIMNKVTRTLTRTKFKFKKHSPEILVVSGVVGVVAGTVMACKATTKLDDILDKANDDLDKIHEAIEHPEELPEEYTEADGKKDLTIVYARTALEVVKLYAPAVAVGTLSITAILAGHNITRKRNVALAAAYTTIDNSFKEYRGRVIERFGKELDRELKYNIKAQEIEVTELNEDGTETTTKKTVEVIDPNTMDDTSRIWDVGNPGWTKSPELNKKYLTDMQRFANDRLKHEGVLMLNDVYAMLGYAKTAQGAIIGWIYDEKNPVGDNFIDFGLREEIEFYNCRECSVLLSFNHDGYILDKI